MQEASIMFLWWAIMACEIYIDTNGCLLSRRLITKENGVAITTSDVSSVTLTVYRFDFSDGGYTTTVISNQTLQVSNVVGSVQTDSQGRQYNFRYCIEGLFTVPGTRYRAEYKLSMTDRHNVLICANCRTRSNQ